MKTQKYILKEHIKKRILASHELIGRIADLSFDSKGKKLQYQTIRSRLIHDSPILTSAESIAAIKKVLKIAPTIMIYECVEIGSPELHHE